MPDRQKAIALAYITLAKRRAVKNERKVYYHWGCSAVTFVCSDVKFDEILLA